MVIEYGFRKAAPVVIPGTDKQDPVVHEHGISQYGDNSIAHVRPKISSGGRRMRFLALDLLI